MLSTGGYDVSNGNTNSGVVNSSCKRGSYPGAGQATLLRSTRRTSTIASRPSTATRSPDNRFSYFFAYNGLRQYRTYGDQHTFFPQ